MILEIAGNNKGSYCIRKSSLRLPEKGPSPPTTGIRTRFPLSPVARKKEVKTFGNVNFFGNSSRSSCLFWQQKSYMRPEVDKTVNKRGNKMVFVCDLGFSSLKWIFGDQKGRIISAHRRTHDGRILVGDEALMTAGSSYLKTVEDLVHFYPTFVEVAANAGRVPEKAPLIVGLPYSAWAADKDRPAGAVSTLTKVLNGSGWPDVRVLPQGLGGIRLFMGHNPGTKGNVLAVDIGFNTVIFTLFAAETRSIIYGDTFYKRGVHQMATQLLLPNIRELAPSRTFTPVEVSYLIERGYIQYGFERHDISQEIEKAAKTYIEDVLRDINGELQAHLGLKAVFETVLVFGGGATLIRDTISSNRVNIRILPEPEFANAAGFVLADG